MKIYSTLLLLFQVSIASCQDIDFTSRLEFKLVHDTLSVNLKEPYINLSYEIANKNKKNLIFYRYRSQINLLTTIKLVEFCDQNTRGAGMTLCLFDKDMNVKNAIHYYSNDSKNPMTEDRADSIMNAENISSLKATLILNKSESAALQQMVNLKEFNLKKGAYYIQLLYSAGKNIGHFANTIQVNSDRRKYKAEVVQGCVFSNKVVLIVK